MKKTFVCLLVLAGVLVSGMAWAQEDAATALAAESEAYCNSTAANPVTPQMVMEKVRAAAELVAKDGDAAFPKFKGKGSEYLFSGTYIWIHDIDGVMIMHPIKNKMEGKPMISLKDANGKMFFVEMNTVAQEKGEGWVEYVWPKPGEKDPVAKTSFVKLVKVGDKQYIVGCGVYDWTLEKVNQALGQ